MKTRNGNSLYIQSFLLNLSIMILLDLSPHSVVLVAIKIPNLSMKEESKIVAKAKSKEALMRGDKRMRIEERKTEGVESKSRRTETMTEKSATNPSMLEGVLSVISTQFPRKNPIGECLRKPCLERPNIHRDMEMSAFQISPCPTYPSP